MPNAIITGANRGIGLEFCRALTERGYHVTALCRQSSEALEGLPVEVHTNFDVTDTDAIQTFASNVAPGSIDLLINNAAIMQSVSLDHMDLDAVRRQLEVNAIAPLQITHALIPALKKGSKIALITSRMGSIADNDSGGSYGVSKGVMFAHDSSTVMTERDDAGAGEGCDVNQNIRFEAARVRQCVAKNQSSFRIGIQNFDGLARHATDNIARPCRRSAWQVLAGWNDDIQVDRQFKVGDSSHSADHAGRTTHVEFHFVHAGPWFQGNAAGIERDSLANQHDRFFAGRGALVLHHDQFGWLR